MTDSLANLEIPKEFLEKLSTEEAFRLLGFKDNKYGNLVRCWGDIEVSAGPWMGCWKMMVMINRNTSRQIYLPQEYPIWPNMLPIDILATIYTCCRELFRTEEPPQELLWGKRHMERYWEKLRQEEAKRPKVWADREFFRFCMSYIEKMNDWSEEDFEIQFSHAEGQLKIQTKGVVVCCPAVGTFYGTLTISARQFFRRMPKRFLANTVRIIVMSENKATIESHSLPVTWLEASV
ncbi:MAG: hypothetical protein PHN84_15445 [Desulfuromonadaceae bacterium]|nr:hypothetical protein [Desulfuromonadaceae bacterium]MDD2856632.1 hypothetical protein [Desulfuromonadaceae bacterium]